LPRSESVFWAFSGGSQPGWPSPVLIQRFRSGPKTRSPPLWFSEAGWGIDRRVSDEAGSARSGRSGSRRKLAIVTAFALSV
jgi:hypothetical protein